MKKIVLVHEDAYFLDILHERLTEESYSVEYYLLAWNSLAEIIDLKPDLILISMPSGEEQQAWKLIERLRITVETALIPIILCPLYSPEMEDRERFLLSKKIRLLYKPLDLDELLHTIQQILLPTTSLSVQTKPAQSRKINKVIEP